ncbi:hypothetical protein CL629_04145 [bacterium]|nr:hypothetical protein [bacterium]|tara:strand:+ start:2859 stop:3428 length:570 start_codon:yes stop_codon:yes gene_type:complete
MPDEQQLRIDLPKGVTVSTSAIQAASSVPDKEVIPNPEGPWIFSGGRTPGKSVEQLMFLKYKRVLWFATSNEMRDERLKQHAKWLIQQGENRVVRESCAFCEKPAQVFYAEGGSSGYAIVPKQVACEACLRAKQFWEAESGDLKFPVLLDNRFSSEECRRGIVEVFKSVFEIRGNITIKAAFDFFCRED